MKSLQNEKAVLSAAVEARDSKLSQLSMQVDELKTLRQKATESEKVQNQLDDMNLKQSSLQEEIKMIKGKNLDLEVALKEARSEIEKLRKARDEEKNALIGVNSEISTAKMQCQKLRGERNMFKQKADSLAKEMSRLCRNGRDIKSIEAILHDQQALSSEVQLLRSEKKKAINELQKCRNEYQQYIIAQIEAASDNESVRIIQKNIELERVVTEMTEYLDAKQMQLESVQEANRSLVEELRLMAERCRDQNDV